MADNEWYKALGKIYGVGTHFRQNKISLRSLEDLADHRREQIEQDFLATLKDACQCFNSSSPKSVTLLVGRSHQFEFSAQLLLESAQLRIQRKGNFWYLSLSGVDGLTVRERTLQTLSPDVDAYGTIWWTDGKGERMTTEEFIKKALLQLVQGVFDFKG